MTVRLTLGTFIVSVAIFLLIGGSPPETSLSSVAMWGLSSFLGCGLCIGAGSRISRTCRGGHHEVANYALNTGLERVVGERLLMFEILVGLSPRVSLGQDLFLAQAGRLDALIWQCVHQLAQWLDFCSVIRKITVWGFESQVQQQN